MTDLVSALRTPRTGKVLRGVLGIAVVVGAIELAGRIRLVDPRVLPLPSTVVRDAVDLAGNGQFLADVGATLGAWAEALVITVVVAVPLGLVLGALSWADVSARPVVEFLRPIPSVALVPLVLIILKDDLRMQLAVVVYAAMWPVLINTIYGVREVDPLAKEALRSFGFGQRAVLGLVSLPSAAPFIATGVRLAASTALVVAIAVELIGSGLAGIGAYVIQAESGPAATAMTIAAALWAGVLGLVINAVLTAAERRLFRWHHGLSAEGR